MPPPHVHSHANANATYEYEARSDVNTNARARHRAQSQYAAFVPPPTNIGGGGGARNSGNLVNVNAGAREDVSSYTNANGGNGAGYHNAHAAAHAHYSSQAQSGSTNRPQHHRLRGAYYWSKEEDRRLTHILKKYKNHPTSHDQWFMIAREFNSNSEGTSNVKTLKECHERWIRYLKPGVRKGQWQDHEDAIVVEAVTTSAEQPFTRWSDLAQRLPGRVGKQIRDRWVNHLNPNINHMPFSPEDDRRLYEGYLKSGKKWVEISSKVFQNTRSENHIKNRWYSASFKKFITKEYGPDAYTREPNTVNKASSSNASTTA